MFLKIEFDSPTDDDEGDEKVFIPGKSQASH